MMSEDAGGGVAPSPFFRKMKSERTGRGGARPGAGRKKSASPRTETITLRVCSAVKTGLRQQAQAEGLSIGSLVEAMLTERMQAPPAR